MALEHVIEQLRSSLADNDAAEDVFRNFSERDRAWDSVSVRPLWVAIKKQGGRHSIGAIADVLGAMADAGVGKPKTEKLDVKGPRVVKLTNLQYDLRKIGAAMLSSYKNVGRYQADRKELNIEGTAEVVKKAPTSLKVYPARNAGHLSITLNIQGTTVSLIIPDGTPIHIIEAIYERLRKTDDASYGK